jgi:hypothetical protein
MNLSGTGVLAPAVSLSPASVNFGNQTVGLTSAPQTVTLTNIGSATLTITSIGLTGANPHQFGETSSCGSSLNAGASCTISVTYQPGVSGPKIAALTITDNAAGSPHSVAMSATGIGP